MRWVLTVLVAVLLAGCTGSGKSGAQVLKPWTWLSHREASSADRAEARVDAAAAEADDAREELLKAAQRETHRAGEALAKAPESRPVAVARNAVQNAASAQDQALGPLTVEQATELRQRVDELLSENATIREKAEAAQARDTQSLMDAARRLADAEAKLIERAEQLAAAQSDLRAAFDRENALANKLRGQRWMMVGLGVAAVVGYGLLTYVRITRGGLLTTLIGRIDVLKKSKGESDPVVKSLLEDLGDKMSRWEKRLVKKVRVTA